MMPAQERDPIPGSPADILDTIERVLTTLDTLDGAMAVYSARMAEIGGQLVDAERRLADLVRTLGEIEWIVEDEAKENAQALAQTGTGD